MFNFDLHIHSYFSNDSINSPEDIVKHAIARGLTGIAITDHNCFKVDFEALQKRYPSIIIIPGMEISTEIGHILAYCISQKIKSVNSLDVVREIHDQGGIAVLAHPYQQWAPLFRFLVRIKRNIVRKNKLFAPLKKREYTETLLKQLDAIEVFNSRNSENNELALALAKKFDKPLTAGSDAHFLFEIGRAVITVKKNKNFIHTTDKADQLKNITRPLDGNTLKNYILSGTVSITRKYNNLPFYMSQIIRLLKK